MWLFKTWKLDDYPKKYIKATHAPVSISNNEHTNMCINIQTYIFLQYSCARDENLNPEPTIAPQETKYIQKIFRYILSTYI